MRAIQNIVVFLLGVFLLLYSTDSIAQNLRGKVIDAENKEPLIGACLVVESTSLGTCTDIDGNFILENSPRPPFTIKVTYLGYDSLLYTVNNAVSYTHLTLPTTPYV